MRTATSCLVFLLLVIPFVLGQNEDCPDEDKLKTGECTDGSQLNNPVSWPEAQRIAMENDAVLPMPTSTIDMEAIKERAGLNPQDNSRPLDVWTGYIFIDGNQVTDAFGQNITLGLRIRINDTEGELASRQVDLPINAGNLCVVACGSELLAVRCSRRFGFFTVFPRIWPSPAIPRLKIPRIVEWPWPWLCPWWNHCCDNRQVTHCYEWNRLYLEDVLPVTLTQEECQQTCVAFSECKFFNWNEPTGLCGIRSYTPGGVVNSLGQKAGTRTHVIPVSNVAYVGRTEFTNSPAECQALCQRDPKCHSFTYNYNTSANPNRRVCVLNYGPTRKIVPLNNVPFFYLVSGPKFCRSDPLKRDKELPNFDTSFNEYIGRDFVPF